MKHFGWKATSFAAVLLYALFGILMLLWPTFLLRFTNYILATVLCAVAVSLIVHYFRVTVTLGAPGFSLALGLLLLLIGVVLFVKPNLLQNLLPFIWGLALVIGGFGKVQMSADLKRVGDSKWWTIMLGAVISLVLGVLCILQPGTIATMLTMFIGISLLAEAALDLIAMLIMRRRVGQSYAGGSGSVR